MTNYSRNFSYNQPPNRLPTKQEQGNTTIIKVVVGIAVLIFLFVIVKSVFASGNGDDKKAQAVAEPAKRKVDTSQLRAQLLAVVEKYPYDTGVAVVDINSGTVIQAGDDYPFIAASTTKLLTALLYLSDVEDGKASLTQTIGGKPAKEQLKLMINKSDNTAWAQLNAVLTEKRLSEYANTHGLPSYDVDKNTVTPTDMAKLIAQLQQGKLINKENTSLLLGWMQNTSEERFIPSAVPTGNKVFHKAGYLEDRVHDVAIVDNGSAPFVIVIYSKAFKNQVYSYTKAQNLFKDLTTTTVTTFK